jgi:glyceraldehyde 3-phosphate dehydrogenase
MPTYVLGVNHKQWITEGKPAVISNASCTTNCLAPIAKVLNDNYVIKRGLMNTIHAYTNDQKILDQMHSDLRRSRSAAVNIIPTTTGAAKAIGLVIPELKGKMDGFALRVPTVTGSVVDLTVELAKSVPGSNEKEQADAVNAALTAAAEGELNGILGVATDPIVSMDIVQDSHSSIADLEMTKVLDGTFVKVLSWYDNEWGYSCRCIDLLHYMAELDAA